MLRFSGPMVSICNNFIERNIVISAERNKLQLVFCTAQPTRFRWWSQLLGEKTQNRPHPA